jgi:pimeloyl-ACP methyl ester carboxylesterase
VWRPIQPCDWICRQNPSLYQPPTETRQCRLATPHRAEREIAGAHVIHPGLDGRRREVANTRRPTLGAADEDQELRQHPSIGRHPSFGLPALLALERSELLDQVMLATTRRGFQLARWAPGLLTLVARRAISRREQFLGKLRRELPECDRRILARPEVAQVQAENYGDALSTDEMAREMVLLRRQRGFAVSDIRVPVELWHGELDRNVPVAHGRRMAAAIANCRTHFFADAGHYVFFDELDFILAPIAAAI